MADKKPVPVVRKNRICFGIAWFASEADAQAYADATRGLTYNGGMYHGMPCGRDRTFDYIDPQHGQLFAVTD